jgi:hypothetical protein
VPLHFAVGGQGGGLVLAGPCRPEVSSPPMDAPMVRAGAAPVLADAPTPIRTDSASACSGSCGVRVRRRRPCNWWWCRGLRRNSWGWAATAAADAGVRAAVGGCVGVAVGAGVGVAVGSAVGIAVLAVATACVELAGDPQATVSVSSIRAAISADPSGCGGWEAAPPPEPAGSACVARVDSIAGRSTAISHLERSSLSRFSGSCSVLKARVRRTAEGARVGARSQPAGTRVLFV